VCQGRSNALRRAQGQRCTARYIPGRALDDRVWQDRCALLTAPDHLAVALRRAHGGHWLPQELQARHATLRHALIPLDTAQQRLLDAYLAGVLTLPVFDRKRHERTRRQEALQSQQRQLDAVAQQHRTLSAVAASLEAFCAQVRDGLHAASFQQRRALVELLIDRVIVTDSDVEIRYVFPTTCHGPPIRFSLVRVDYLPFVAQPILLLARQHRSSAFGSPLDGTALGGDAHLDAPTSQCTMERVSIIPAIRHQFRGPLPGTPLWSGDRDGIQRPLRESDLGAGSAVEMVAEWEASAVNDQHPLGTFSLLGEADLVAALLGRREGAVEESYGPIELAFPVESG